MFYSVKYMTKKSVQYYKGNSNSNSKSGSILHTSFLSRTKMIQHRSVLPSIGFLNFPTTRITASRCCCAASHCWCHRRNDCHLHRWSIRRKKLLTLARSSLVFATQWHHFDSAINVNLGWSVTKRSVSNYN